jgi:hypothetical protein
MAIILDTTSIPGKTIVIEDTNGNIAIVPEDYSAQLSSIRTSIDRLNPDTVSTTAVGTETTLTFPNAIVSSEHEGFFVEGTGIPQGTYIVKVLVTGVSPDFTYTAQVSENVDNFNGTIRVIAPIVKMAKEVTLLREATQGINTANTAVKEIVTGEQETIGAGIPFKDAYAGLSMSTLIKTLEEEKVNINNLIAKTKRYLDSV